MPHGTHEISSKGNGEGKSAQGSPPLPFLLYVQEPSPTKPLRPGKHPERQKMRCRLHRTDKREAHYKDGEAAVRSPLGCCPPYGSSYVHLMQRGASAIAAQCIGLRSAMGLMHICAWMFPECTSLKIFAAVACAYQNTFDRQRRRASKPGKALYERNAIFSERNPHSLPRAPRRLIFVIKGHFCHWANMIKRLKNNIFSIMSCNYNNIC